MNMDDKNSNQIEKNQAKSKGYGYLSASVAFIGIIGSLPLGLIWELYLLVGGVIIFTTIKFVLRCFADRLASRIEKGIAVFAVFELLFLIALMLFSFDSRGSFV